MKVFISYSKNRDQVSALSDGMKVLGHEVWYDNLLGATGGQEWWPNILSNIRMCELFVFALSTQSMASNACALEYRYAHALNKRILPVMFDNVSVSTLPVELRALQIVDYRVGDAKQGLSLAASLNNLPGLRALPDPLPPEPETPYPPITRITNRLEQPNLDAREQNEICVELETLMNNPETRADAGILLKNLYGRHDTLAKTAERIRTHHPELFNHTTSAVQKPVSEQLKIPEGARTETNRRIIEAVGPLFDFDIRDVELNQKGKLTQNQAVHLFQYGEAQAVKCVRMRSRRIILLLIFAVIFVISFNFMRSNDHYQYYSSSTLTPENQILYDNYQIGWWGLLIAFTLGAFCFLLIFRQVHNIGRIRAFQRSTRSDFSKAIKSSSGSIKYSDAYGKIYVQIQGGKTYEAEKRYDTRNPEYFDDPVFGSPISAQIYTTKIAFGWEQILLSAAPSETRR